MRIIAAALAFSLIGLPVVAQTAATPPPAATPAVPAATPPPVAAAPAVTPPTKPPAKRTVRRQTLRERFQAANTLHDGHLTADQAKAAKWTYIARRFDAIDSAKKGYVTVEDIQAYAKAQRDARKAAKAAKPAP